MEQKRPSIHLEEEPAELLVDFLFLFREKPLSGPVLDLACGDCRNGIEVARLGHAVHCCDISDDALSRAESLAQRLGVSVEILRLDLERDDAPVPAEDTYGAVLVFRYLHRPLIPCIRKALKPGGVLIYETFTTDQARFGKPRNPDYLLKKGELREWFRDWELLHYFEGLKTGPDRAVAQLVCRKPGE